MFLKRTLVVILLLPIGLAAIFLGGWYFVALVAIVLLLAGFEYAQLFQDGDYRPSSWIILGGILLMVLSRSFYGFDSSPWIFSLLILVSMAVHLFAYERGRDRAATDFAITLSGVFYVGWLGSYLISLRELEQGLWWVLLVLVAVWLADAGAYIVGKALGKHKITPRLSPGKTWEGYFGGIVTGTVGTILLALFFQHFGKLVSENLIIQAAGLGVLLSSVTILGDLGESMIKRQVGKKDSGSLLPGHGGVFDRIDSWLWAGVLGYYLIVWLR